MESERLEGQKPQMDRDDDGLAINRIVGPLMDERRNYGLGWLTYTKTLAVGRVETTPMPLPVQLPPPVCVAIALPKSGLPPVVVPALAKYLDKWEEKQAINALERVLDLHYEFQIREKPCCAEVEAFWKRYFTGLRLVKELQPSPGLFRGTSARGLFGHIHRARP